MFGAVPGLASHPHGPSLTVRRTSRAALLRRGRLPPQPHRGELVSSRLPALDGVADKRDAEAAVVDAGCGHGHSTVIMAEAYPSSRFCGYDMHEASIGAARENAPQAKLDDRVAFDVADARGYPRRAEVHDAHGIREMFSPFTSRAVRPDHRRLRWLKRLRRAATNTWISGTTSSYRSSCGSNTFWSTD
ncbi:MAG: methyltransferase domain-containing protein [Gammaproteobacteria bacterium]|nr:methyltransferase domain-containing protein [Gammaproteobacteria bacterium]NIR84537.1 methyltransferase domain-containing protein [Gammaproteobacteria bacterium]NIR90440.1 methyltransferase domain-containing protein [Gammaproteobacteria bacterium]NIU05588.1 methyltransferase domain-containing protein [Gammaproteobacteria bacterium]NIV52727.1 methyltransferase domain-containing protein [Gammaproteobacteria bacterium]